MSAHLEKAEQMANLLAHCSEEGSIPSRGTLADAAKLIRELMLENQDLIAEVWDLVDDSNGGADDKLV